MAWKVTSLRKPCERKRLATMHSWTMSSLPASCRLLKAGLVFPMRENRMNSLVKIVTGLVLCFACFKVLSDVFESVIFL